MTNTRSSVLRVGLRVVLAVAATIPAAVALLPIAAADAAWAVGIAGVFIVVLTALQNALEDSGRVPTLWKDTTDAA